MSHAASPSQTTFATFASHSSSYGEAQWQRYHVGDGDEGSLVMPQDLLQHGMQRDALQPIAADADVEAAFTSWLLDQGENLIPDVDEEDQLACLLQDDLVLRSASSFPQLHDVPHTDAAMYKSETQLAMALGMTPSDYPRLDVTLSCEGRMVSFASDELAFLASDMVWCRTAIA